MRKAHLTLMVLIGIGFLGWDCSAPPKDRHVQIAVDEFPPAREEPIKVLLAPPLEGFDIGRHPKVLFQGVPWAVEDPMAYIRCIWEDGQSYLVNKIGIGIDFRSTAASVSDQLAHPRHWLRWQEGAALYGHFVLEDPTALAAIRSAGYDYVVVPKALHFRPAPDVNVGYLDALESIDDRVEERGLSGYIELGGSTAIVDVRQGLIAWCGDVAVGGTIPIYRFKTHFRDLNTFEILSYSWITDLLMVFQRGVTEIRHLHQLTQVCG